MSVALLSSSVTTLVCAKQPIRLADGRLFQVSLQPFELPTLSENERFVALQFLDEELRLAETVVVPESELPDTPQASADLVFDSQVKGRIFGGEQVIQSDWVSQGVAHVFWTARADGESVAQWVRRHVSLLTALTNQHPPESRESNSAAEPGGPAGTLTEIQAQTLDAAWADGNEIAHCVRTVRTTGEAIPDFVDRQAQVVAALEIARRPARG